MAPEAEEEEEEAGELRDGTCPEREREKKREKDKVVREGERERVA